MPHLGTFSVTHRDPQESGDVTPHCIFNDFRSWKNWLCWWEKVKHNCGSRNWSKCFRACLNRKWEKCWQFDQRI